MLDRIAGALSWLWNGSSSETPPPSLLAWQQWVTVLPFMLCPRRSVPTSLDLASAEIARRTLEDCWGATDLESTREVLETLRTGMHGPRFKAAREQAAALAGRPSADPHVTFVAGLARVPAQEIRAWDLGRLVAASRTAFSADYMSEAELVRWLATVGHEVRHAGFDSWETWGESFALGWEFWLVGKEPADDDRALRQTLATMLADPGSPWRQIGWYDGALPA